MNNKIKIAIQSLNKNFKQPQYASDEASGMDIFSCNDEDIILNPMERILVPTGFAMELPKGYEAQIRPRSGLALKNGITVLNSPGTIDSDYRGEVQILLINLGQKSYTIKKGQRIAQMVVQKVFHAEINIVLKLKSSSRGSGGFGSTGVQ